MNAFGMTHIYNTPESNQHYKYSQKHNFITQIRGTKNNSDK